MHLALTVASVVFILPSSTLSPTANGSHHAKLVTMRDGTMSAREMTGAGGDAQPATQPRSMGPPTLRNVKVRLAAVPRETEEDHALIIAKLELDGDLTEHMAMLARPAATEGEPAPRAGPIAFEQPRVRATARAAELGERAGQGDDRRHPQEARVCLCRLGPVLRSWRGLQCLPPLCLLTSHSS